MVYVRSPGNQGSAAPSPPQSKANNRACTHQIRPSGRGAEELHWQSVSHHPV